MERTEWMEFKARAGLAGPIIAGLIFAVLASGCNRTSAAGSPEASSEPGAKGRWALEADYVDACNCRPACPCLYGSPPTEHRCEGATLVDIEHGHFENVDLDGVRVVAVYRGGEWIKFYVGEEASAEQAAALVKLLPTFEDFFAVENVIEVERVPLSLSRQADRLRFSVPNTDVEIELMHGAGGMPIKTEGLPHPAYGKAPAFLDHTQYRTLELEHRGGEQRFSYSGTNAYTARIKDAEGL